MSSRTNTEVARLRRLRRFAARHNLAILASEKPSSKVPGGGYMLNDNEARKPVIGAHPQPYSASLDEVEEYLDKLSETDEL
ncbi:MAG TPA: hypothetical protein VGM83_06260 [Devosiaceae bacterium]|jgi:hypothetical protein